MKPSSQRIMRTAIIAQSIATLLTPISPSAVDSVKEPHASFTFVSSQQCTIRATRAVAAYFVTPLQCHALAVALPMLWEKGTRATAKGVTTDGAQSGERLPQYH